MQLRAEPSIGCVIEHLGGDGFAGQDRAVTPSNRASASSGSRGPTGAVVDLVAVLAQQRLHVVSWVQVGGGHQNGDIGISSWMVV